MTDTVKLYTQETMLELVSDFNTAAQEYGAYDREQDGVEGAKRLTSELKRAHTALSAAIGMLLDAARGAGTPTAPDVTDEDNFSQSMDAVLWAKAFLKAYELGDDHFLDEGTMIAWFANAIMRGYDEANRRRDEQLRASEAHAPAVPDVRGTPTAPTPLDVEDVMSCVSAFGAARFAEGMMDDGSKQEVAQHEAAERMRCEIRALLEAGTPTAPDVTDEDVERACALYVARLAGVPDGLRLMADFPDRVAAMRKVLEGFASRAAPATREDAK
jgi:hypothetical protein